MNKSRAVWIAAFIVVVLIVSATVVLVLFQREGTELVFDGRTTSGWVIEGDSQVEDGVLVVGGNHKTWARIAADVRPVFEVHLEYRTENNQPIQLEWHSRRLLSRGMHSGTLERRSNKAEDWIEAVLTGHENAGGGWSSSAKWRAVGDAAFTERPQGGTAELPSSAFVAFEIPAGQKLYLRNVRMKAQRATILPWLLVAMFAAVVVMLAIVVVAWAISRKQGAQSSARAQAPLKGGAGESQSFDSGDAEASVEER